jgi:uncharacterized metal-binding protein YceD (DUF177 family)
MAGGLLVKLNLLQLRAGSPHEEKTLGFEHGVDFSGVRVWGEKPFRGPVAIKGEAKLRAGVFTLEYEARYAFHARCSRCLEEITREMRPVFSHTVVLDAEDESAGGHINAVAGEIDLDELAVSDILLEFEGVPLCREDCAGISGYDF